MMRGRLLFAILLAGSGAVSVPGCAHVRAYATWHVAHQLARTSQSGRTTPAAQKDARSLISEAIKLINWLHEQQLELRDLRLDHIDAWIADGASTRRRVTPARKEPLAVGVRISPSLARKMLAVASSATLPSMSNSRQLSKPRVRASIRARALLG